MTQNTVFYALVALLVLAYILYRQLAERPIKDNPLKLPAILAVVGLIETMNYLRGPHHVEVGEVVAMFLGFAVAALIAVPRAHTMHIYRNTAGVLVRRGNAVTISLWILAIAAHIVIALLVPELFDGRHGSLGGLESASILLFLGISLGVQALITRDRAGRAAAT
ncbi:hypothetical protein ACPXB3_09440 [Gordonia sp. DT219]|uniref:hypothetical protein n=1 Tax=Gordonia sp. DT219 TaxID=3416658 RepID=UPI003CE945EA